MSDRFLAAAVIAERRREYRWRGVRTAPKGVGPQLSKRSVASARQPHDVDKQRD